MRTDVLSAYAPDPAFPFHVEESAPSGDIPLHGHGDFTEITLVLGGSALCRVGQEEFLLRRGDLVTADETVTHGFFQPQDFRVYTARFPLDALTPPQADLREAPGFRALFLSSEGRRVIHLEDASRLRLEGAFAAALEEYRRQQPGWQTCMKAHLTALTAFAARQSEALPAPPPEGLGRALAYLEDHYTEEIALTGLARIAGISPRHFDRVFAREYHLTPRAYMTRLRMARAKALLRTQRPITEIAFDCGYADSNYFSQVFRRHTGMSPQQYRREINK